MIGQIVERIFINEDQSVIKFQFLNKAVGYFVTESDCCSETWFADIIGVKALLESGEILRIELKSMDLSQDNRSRQDSDEFYSIELTTNRGVCTFAFRNSSNGYYGGSAHYTECFDCVAHTKWTEITEDYSA